MRILTSRACATVFYGVFFFSLTKICAGIEKYSPVIITYVVNLAISGEDDRSAPGNWSTVPYVVLRTLPSPEHQRAVLGSRRQRSGLREVGYNPQDMDLR